MSAVTLETNLSSTDVKCATLFLWFEFTDVIQHKLYKLELKDITNVRFHLRAALSRNVYLNFNNFATFTTCIVHTNMTPEKCHSFEREKGWRWEEQRDEETMI